MDRVIDITGIVQREVEDYAVSGFNIALYPVSDHPRQIYTVIVIPEYDSRKKIDPGIVVMARIVGDTVIIDEDTTDRPLYKELMRAGIPREQIILAYAGEKSPEASSKENS
jgi:XisI protein